MEGSRLLGPGMAVLVMLADPAAAKAQLLNPAEMTKGMAQSGLMEGRAYLDASRYRDAALKFEEVWDIDDPDHDISDERAVAGVFLCLARAKANLMAAAREACQNVLNMPDAPQQTKRQASTLLDKIK